MRVLVVEDLLNEPETFAAMLRSQGHDPLVIPTA